MARRRIVYTPLTELTPAPRNPQGHDLATLKASYERFGYTIPVLWCERKQAIAAGHGRVELLLAMRDAGEPMPDGITKAKGDWLVPVERGWASKDDAEFEAYLLADNQLTVLGIRDDKLLSEMLADLVAGPGLLGTGFDEAALKALLAAQPKPLLADPDAIPEPPKVPVTKFGDLWLLGDHRLLCGDATKREDYERVLGGEHLSGAVIADPPYGVAIGAKNRALDSIDRAGRVLTDLEGDQGIEEVEKLWREAFTTFMLVMPPGTPYYVFGPQGGDLGLLLLLLRDSGLAPRHILIWVKNRPSFSIGRLDYDYQHEPIVYGWRPGGAHPWHADGTRTSILAFDRPQASPLHPTAKPVALLVHLIGNSTAPGQTVLDPFGGSGSTLIACEQTGRVARLMEIDPTYCDVICRRYEQATGNTVVLEGG